LKLFQRDRERAAESAGAELPLPEPPHPVQLVMPNGERMPGRVLRLQGEELTVLMLFKLGRELREAERSSIVIEARSQAGTIRLGGRAHSVDHETLCFSDLHLVQRREYVRVKVSLPVAVIAPGDVSIPCTSIDLSGGGMLLHGVRHRPVGEKIEFFLTPGGEDGSISGTARILRHDARGNTAICFEHISEGDRRRLIRFLFERQREERRRGLRPEGAHAG
jgi:PilZ domain